MRLFAILFVVHASACLSLAQTKQVLKGISTNALTESLVVPTGKTLTIDAGGTIINNGTATGFTTGLAIGTSAITGGTSGHVLYNNAGTLGGIDLSAVYQALNTNLTTIANLANGTGVLTNNGSGTFSYTATSTGGNGDADAGKLATFDASGALRTTSGGGTAAGVFIQSSDNAINSLSLSTSGIVRTFEALKVSTIQFATPSGTGFQSRAITVPATTGTLITTGDTGTVTNAMLAGSIALSKLATTGTASASTYLRGDGAWSSIDLSAYLPLTGGTLSGNLTSPNVILSASSGTFQGVTGGSAPQFTATGSTGNGMRVATDRLDFWLSSSVQFVITSGNVNFGSSAMAWSSNTLLLGNSDGTGRLVQRNSTSPQTFSIANTYTSFTSKEEFEIGWVGNSNICRLRPIKGSGGGSSRNAEYYTTEAGVNWGSGSGSPEGVRTAPVGSLYTRTDGGASTTLYVKESGTGNTGWVAK